MGCRRPEPACRAGLPPPPAAAAASGAGEHPVFHRATDRRAGATPVGEHLLTPLGAEAIQSEAAQLQQVVALVVAQLLSSHQGVGALLAAGDAVEGEPCSPCARRVRWCKRSGSRPPPGSAWPRPAPGPGWLLPGKSVAEQLQEHQRLVDVAHAHAFGDVVPRALVGGGGAGAWGDAGDSRATRPGLVLGGPTGHRPCWESFWRGRAAAAANPAAGVAVPPQPPAPRLMTKGTQGLKVLL